MYHCRVAGGVQAEIILAGSNIGGGRYQVERITEEHAESTVLEALDTKMGRSVTIDLLTSDPPPRHEAQRFELETAMHSRLDKCREIARVYDVGVDRGRPFLVRQYLPGGNARMRLLSGNCQTPDEVRRVGLDIARALRAVHAEGYAHRDVRLENFLFDEYGNAYLGGLASSLEVASASGPFLTILPSKYVAPELSSGSIPNAQADLYALGFSLLELAMGSSELEEIPDAIAATKMPIELRYLITQLLERNPDKRPSSASELVAALVAIPESLNESLDDLISAGENEHREFKASLIRSTRDGVPEDHAFDDRDDLEFAVLKSIAGFLNSRGGVLLIGVSDTGAVLGIEPDLSGLSKKPTVDGWLLHLSGLMRTRLDPYPASSTSIDTIQFEDDDTLRTVGIVRVATWCNGEVWLRDGNRSKLFVRSGAETHELTGTGISAHIRRDKTPTAP